MRSILIQTSGLFPNAQTNQGPFVSLLPSHHTQKMAQCRPEVRAQNRKLTPDIQIRAERRLKAHMTFSGQ